MIQTRLFLKMAPFKYEKISCRKELQQLLTYIQLIHQGGITMSWNKQRIMEWGEYIRVWTNCPFRRGWIMEVQVNKSEWDNPKYDKYKR